MKILNAFVLSMVILFGVSCKKDHDPDNLNPQQFVLKSVEYPEQNSKAEYAYDSEGLLQEIKFNGTLQYTSNYDFLNKAIKKISVSPDLQEDTYSYLNGQITSIMSRQLNHADRGDRLVFSYNANGTVSELKYYLMDISGGHIAYTSDYEYDDAGRIKRVVSVNADGMIEWIIENYSAECVFNPFTFIPTSIAEAYEIFNYPVLNKLKQLPAKISKRVHTADRDHYTQAVYTTDFVILNKRIEKMTASVRFPESSNADFTATAIFKY